MKIDGAADEDNEARVELTPLIDVVFQLLIFFMVTMSFVKNREYLLPVDLAETTMAETPSDDPYRGLTITVMEDDKVVVDGDEVLTDDDEVESRLRSLYAEDVGAQIMLRGDEAARHGRVIAMLDLVKAIGFDRVDMIVTTFEE